MPVTLVTGGEPMGSVHVVVAVNGPSAFGETMMFWVAGVPAETLSRIDAGDAVKGPVVPEGIGDGVPLEEGEGVGPSTLMTMSIGSVAVWPPPPVTVMEQSRLSAASCDGRVTVTVSPDIEAVGLPRSPTAQIGWVIVNAPV